MCMSSNSGTSKGSRGGMSSSGMPVGIISFRISRICLRKSSTGFLLIGVSNVVATRQRQTRSPIVFMVMRVLKLFESDVFQFVYLLPCLIFVFFMNSFTFFSWSVRSWLNDGKKGKIPSTCQEIGNIKPAMAHFIHAVRCRRIVSESYECSV